MHGIPRGLCQEPRGLPYGEVREYLCFRTQGLQAGLVGANRGGPPDWRVLPTGGGLDTFCAGREDAVRPGTDSLDGISCRQQDRAILPGAQGLAQKEAGRLDLGHLQTSVYGIISRPGRKNQGHKRGCRLPFIKRHSKKWRGSRAPRPGQRIQQGHFHEANWGGRITDM